jgi:hypothetical protein
MKMKDRVLKAIWKEDEGLRYIIAISAKEDTNKEAFGSEFNIKTNISFVLLDSKNKTYVEWFPQYGPISVIEESIDESDEHRQECYIFDFNKGRGNWSQSVCEEQNLNYAFSEGNYDHIFRVMRRFLNE